MQKAALGCLLLPGFHIVTFHIAYHRLTRDLIADSTEAMALAHAFDALVMVPNCDKNVPGLLVAAARLNLPTIFVSGGPMLAGRIDGHKTSLSSMFEAVGKYKAGKIDETKLKEYELNTCPSCGSIPVPCPPSGRCGTQLPS